MTATIILVSVLITSVISGVLGMAGGMILMAILVSTLSVAGAMMVHGAVQATSNGSRAFFLRDHIRWDILPIYLVGSLVAFGIFALLVVIPDPAIVLILIGLFPWLARATPRLSGLDVTRPLTTLTCGVVVTAAQLLAGASGPLLDVFYLNADLTRQQVVASKAVTQTLGHILKLIYYGLVVGVVDDVAGWLYVAAMGIAIPGARIGTHLLHSWNDERFRKVSGWIILSIASICIVKGIVGLLG